LFISILAPIIAGAISPAGENLASQTGYYNIALMISRLSPIYLFQEAASILMTPVSTQSIFDATGASIFMTASPLSFSQSLLMIWPQLIAMIVLTVVCFAISYIKFMREEIRAL